MKSVYCIPFVSQCFVVFCAIRSITFPLKSCIASLSAISYMNEICNFMRSDGGSKNTQYCSVTVAHALIMMMLTVYVISLYKNLQHKQLTQILSQELEQRS